MVSGFNNEGISHYLGGWPYFNTSYIARPITILYLYGKETE